MLKKILFLLTMVLMLSACGPNPAVYDQYYDQQANADAQRTYQNQYQSQSACFTAFPYPGDCYMGAGGIWFSPLYYPWGAVIHYNHVVGYGLHVPLGGGIYVRPAYRVSVNYGYAHSYIVQRSSYYHTNTTYNPATRSFTPRTSVSSNSVRPAYTPTARPSVNSVPARPTVTAPSRGTAASTFGAPRPANVSRINFGGNSGSNSRSSSSPSYRSSSSSSSRSSSSSSSRSSSRH